MQSTFKFLAVFFSLLSAVPLSAQYYSGDDARNEHRRILFILDASSSMSKPWNSISRFGEASKMIGILVDSLHAKDPNIEFSIRVLGSKYSAKEQNCTDTRVLVQFQPQNQNQIKQALSVTHPLGWSPINYALKSASNDDLTDYHNYHYGVILLTDGEESCGGDICYTVEEHLKKKFFFQPYIIGLDPTNDLSTYYQCIGEYVPLSNISDESTVLQKILDFKVYTPPSTTSIPMFPAVTALPGVKFEPDKEQGKTEDALKAEAARKAEQSRIAAQQQAELERKAKEAQAREEAEKKAAAQRAEKNRIAEEARLRKEAEQKAQEEQIALENQRKTEAAEMAREEKEKREAERIAEQKEKNRIEKENREKEEADRIAELKKKEQDQLAKEEKAKAEAEQKAAEEKARQQLDSIAAVKKAEQERIAKEKKAKEETDRLAAQEKTRQDSIKKAVQQKAEQDRLAKEEADRLAAERARLAKEEADAQREADRLIAQEQARLKAEEAKARKEANMTVQTEADRLAEQNAKGRNPSPIPQLDGKKVEYPKVMVTSTESEKTQLKIYLRGSNGELYQSSPLMSLYRTSRTKPDLTFNRTVDATGEPRPIDIPDEGNYTITFGKDVTYLSKDVFIPKNKLTKVVIDVKPGSIRFAYANNTSKEVVGYTAAIRKIFPDKRVVQYQKTEDREDYTPGNYHININTFPELELNVDVYEGSTSLVTYISEPGKLSLPNPLPSEIILLQSYNSTFKPFAKISNENNEIEYDILPGQYKVSYFINGERKEKQFNIRTTQAYTLTLD